MQKKTWDISSYQLVQVQEHARTYPSPVVKCTLRKQFKRLLPTQQKRTHRILPILHVSLSDSTSGACTTTQLQTSFPWDRWSNDQGLMHGTPLDHQMEQLRQSTLLEKVYEIIANLVQGVYNARRWRCCLLGMCIHGSFTSQHLQTKKHLWLWGIC